MVGCWLWKVLTTHASKVANESPAGSGMNGCVVCFACVCFFVALCLFCAFVERFGCVLCVRFVVFIQQRVLVFCWCACVLCVALSKRFRTYVKASLEGSSINGRKNNAEREGKQHTARAHCE